MSKNPQNQDQNISVYQSKDGVISFNVNIFSQEVWLTQEQIGQLFDKARNTITGHINNIFKDGELEEDVVCRFFRHTTKHGAIKGKTQDKNIKHYNLDIILSVGYRVKSQRGIAFRLWANKILKAYMTNGYAINEVKVKAILEEYITKLRLEFKDDIQRVYEKVADLAGKPINIYNQISLTSNKLESKIIALLDELITKIKTDKNLKNQLEEIKQGIKASPKDKNTQNKITGFFRELGDNTSNLNKTIKGIGISKKVISELVKLGEKLKDLIF